MPGGLPRRSSQADTSLVLIRKFQTDGFKFLSWERLKLQLKSWLAVLGLDIILCVLHRVRCNTKRAANGHDSRDRPLPWIWRCALFPQAPEGTEVFMGDALRVSGEAPGLSERHIGSGTLFSHILV